VAMSARNDLSLAGKGKHVGERSLPIVERPPGPLAEGERLTLDADQSGRRGDPGGRSGQEEVGSGHKDGEAAALPSRS
jgi:hypothetical protein